MKKLWVNEKRNLTRDELRKLYMPLIPVICRVARKSGYAIGVHGSLSRDLDLIAVPWVKDAVLPITLVARCHAAICKYPESATHFKKDGGGKKPHARKAYVLYLGHHGRWKHTKAVYVDLSVFPPFDRGTLTQ